MEVREALEKKKHLSAKNPSNKDHVQAGLGWALPSLCSLSKHRLV
jgi:hypothetical protein